MDGMYLSNAMAMDNQANTTIMSVDDSKVSTNNVWTAQKIYDQYQKKTTAAVGSILTVDANGELVAAAGGGGAAPSPPTELRVYGTFSSTNSGVWTDVQELTLTLSPGTYTVGFNVSMTLENNGNGMLGLLVRLSKDGSIIAGSQRYVVESWPVNGYNGLWGGSASFEAPIITLTSNAVYIVQVARMVRWGTPNLGQAYNVTGYVNAIKYA